jgi:galactonate dehydratase
MKIRRLTVYSVKPRWMFLHVETDDGPSGWGELISGTRTETVTTAVHEIGDCLIGKDPMRIEDVWQRLYRVFWRGGHAHMTVLSAIEMALWDIKGKYYDAPAYELLGGRARDRIRVYSWVGGDRPSEVASAVAERQAQGFQAVKMLATEEMHYIDSFSKVSQAVARVQCVRDAVGYDMDIGIDFHGRVHKAMATVLAKELEPLHPMFIEEPVLPENNEALRDLARHTSIPIATGERLFTRWAFKDILTEGVVDIVQPDVAVTGGILELRKIAAMAEAFDVAVAPHAPYGPVSLAASLQVDACTPNVFIQEQSLGMHYNVGFDLLDFVKNKDMFYFEDGFVQVPAGPGLGLEIDVEKVRQAAVEELHWTNPRWRNADGTVTEW